MSKESLLADMLEAQKAEDGEVEWTHYAFDQLIQDELKRLGYDEVVELFKSQQRWYA